MRNQLKSEFYRATKFKSSYVAPILITVLILLSFLMMWVLIDTIESMGGTGTELARALIYSSSSNGSLPFFIAILASIFVAGSFSNGSIKMSISRGANRVQLYFAKLITVSTMAVLLCIFSFIVSGILAAILGLGQTITAAEFGNIMAALGKQSLIALAYTSLFTLIATLIRSTGGAVGASIGLFFFSTIVSAILSTIGLTTEKQWLVDSTQFFLSTQLATASQFPPLQTWELLCVILIPLGYIAVTSGLGLLSFVKRDIK